MVIIYHRINSIEKLKTVPPRYGVEIDVRHDNRTGKLYLNHDPGTGDNFEEYMKMFAAQKNAFVIFNIKEAGIEQQVIDIAKKYGIENYFLLDVEFPFIFRAAANGKHGLKPVDNLNGRVAIRYSEAEPIEQALSLQGKFKWVWVDTNTRLPLNKKIVQQLTTAGFKLCLVCPERWGRPEDIAKYVETMKKEGIVLDAVMTNEKYVAQWETSEVIK